MEVEVPLEALDVDAIDNVYVFLADCVRYDYTPQRVSGRGLSFKTGAAALCTPQSLPSIVSGRHAPHHGITWFMHSLDEGISTMFDLADEAGYDGDDLWDGRGLQDLIGNPGTLDVEEAHPPFVLLEHDSGGHTPYPGFEGYSTAEMLSEIPDLASLKRHYREAIDRSTDRFERRLATLEDRGLLESTLVIYVSDHGALLGEHGGFVNHGLPSAPETAYVETVFVHESLPSDDSDVFIHHVDLFPTIAELIGGDDLSSEADGESLFGEVAVDRPAYTNGIMRPPDRFRGTIIDPGYRAPSIWTSEGGFVFNETKPYVAPVTAVYDAFFSANTGAFGAGFATKRLLKSMGHYLRSEHRYGSPSISKHDARELATRISAGEVTPEKRTLDEETKAHLEDLGYR